MSLFKKLKYIKEILINIDHKTGQGIHQLLVDGKIQVVKKQWHDDYNSKFTKLDIEKPHGPKCENWKDEIWNILWSTHDGYRTCWVTFEDNKIILDVTFYRGRSLNGSRKSKWWSATFSGLKASDLKIFEHEINKTFRYKMEYIYEDEEELKIENRINEISKNILSKQ